MTHDWGPHQMPDMDAATCRVCGLTASHASIVTGYWTHNDEPLPPCPSPELGWHVIAGTHLLECLRRCQAGEDADLVFAEIWANAEHEEVDPE